MSQELEDYSEEPGQAQEPELSFPGMSLHDFMRQTRVYEHTPVPFSRQLRRTTSLGIVCTCIAMVAIAILPTLVMYSRVLDVGYMSFLDILNGPLYSSVGWLQGQSWLMYLNGAWLISFPVLLVCSRNLQRGPPWQYWLAFAHAVVGMLNLLPVLMPLALLLLKLLVWLLLALIIITVALALLRALFTR